jgi:hypothetical protein
MNCGQFETRLNLVLDQRRSPAGDPALAAHAAVCADCEQLLADETVLVACLAESYTPLLPRRGFAERVVMAADVAVVHQQRSKRIWLAVGVALSSAAVMLLAISIVWQARQPAVSDGATLAQGEFTEADLILGAPRFPNNLIAMAVPHGAALRYEQIERVAPGIRPLRESLALLWNTLFRTLPTERDTNTPPNEERAGRWWAYSWQLA